MQDRLLTLARYNAWADERLWQAAQALSETEFGAHRGAFFGSLCGTLNHIVVATRVWLDRCEGADGGWFRALDQVLEAAPGPLRRLMAAEDARLVGFVEASDASTLAGTADYANTSGKRFASPVHWIVSHVVNHATHHRGQASAILTGLGRPAPEMDLIYYLRQQGLA